MVIIFEPVEVREALKGEPGGNRTGIRKVLKEWGRTQIWGEH